VAERGVIAGVVHQIAPELLKLVLTLITVVPLGKWFAVPSSVWIAML
jgi:hypothetical protein